MTGNRWAGALLLLLAAPAAAQTPAPAPATPAASPPSLPGVDLRYESLSGPLNHPHVEGVHLIYGGELTLDADEADGDLTLKRYIVRGNVRAHEADTTIRAEEITFDGPSQSAAADNARIRQNEFTLRAKHLIGTPQLLTATNAEVSTVPPDETPDLDVRAETVTLDALHHHGILHHASIYLFRNRVLTLRRVTFPYGTGTGAASRQAMIPVFGVSSRYGTYLSFGSSLGGGSFPVVYHLLLPTRQSVEGSLKSSQTLYSPRPSSAPPSDAPPSSGPLTLLDQIRAVATAPVGPLPQGDPLLFHDFLPEPNPIRLFDAPSRGGLGLAEELSVHIASSGNKRDDLYVSRLPEVILTGQLPLTPIPAPPLYGDPHAFRNSLRHIVLFADAQETGGSYREQLSEAPYSTWERRIHSLVGLSTRPILIASNTVMLPRLSISTSSYSGSKSAYRYDQLSLAVNHYFSDLNAIGVQYLASSTSGSSPFNFDVLDTSREMDLRVQFGNRRLVAAGRVRYDLSHSGVIDYQLALAPALRGFSPVFSYSFRTRSLGLGIEVRGITY